MARTAEIKTIEVAGDKMCNAAFFKDFFKLKDINGVYYRMKNLGIRGMFFGDREKYWSLNRVVKELQK